MCIYRIDFSENDSCQIGRGKAPQNLVEDVDFSKLVVDKPWGYEYRMYKNPFAEVWTLFIEKDEITSMHCHPNKKTALIVLQGEVVFSTLNTSIHLKPGHGGIIDLGVFHSSRAISANGVWLLEIETPPLKYDLIRLKDEYGRAGVSYEGKNKMRVEDDGFLRFPELASCGFVEKEFFDSELCIRKIRASYEDIDLQLLGKYQLVVILEGNIRSSKGRILHSVVDIVPCSDYLNDSNSHVFGDLTLLLVKSKSYGT